MERAVLHCDLNNFYASVETVLNPDLKGLPIAVCGKTEERHGIVLAKSEPAKHFGVKTGEAIWEARKKCPDLVIVPTHFAAYREYSEKAREIYYRYTDKIEPFGIDECWLDVTGSQRLFGTPLSMAYQIKEMMKAELGLTISVGVSFNKVFAKLGSDLKKPDAVTEITSDNFREKIWQLPADEMIGVGRKTYATLNRYGIRTIGDVAAASPEFFERLFGKNGFALWQNANGLDASPVAPSDYTPMPKSVGRGVTCTADLQTLQEVRGVLLALSENVSANLRKNGLAAETIQLTVKDNLLACRQYQEKMDYPTQSAREITKKAFELFQKRYPFDRPVRALTVCAAQLLPSDAPCQLDLRFDMEKHEKTEKVESAMLKIRERYGKKAIFEAAAMNNKKMPSGKED